MTAVVGRAWGWVRSWGGGSKAASENTPPVTAEEQKQVSRSGGGWTSWLWGGWRRQSERSSPAEEFWEAQEKLQPMEVEDLGAGKPEAEPKLQQLTRWWSRYVPTYYLPWPRKSEASGVRRRKRDGRGGDDADGDFSDYGTPPPSPTPAGTSPFRLFVDGWKLEILPEHHEICFNFLRHLFDLFVVGFLWTVSPPTKLILEVLGVQGALRLWLHGMAMFLVSTVGMAGLLWLVQEYLPQFALIYGIIQALVISISVRQSVLLDTDEDDGEKEEEGKDTEDVKDGREHKEKLLPVKEKVKTN